MSAHALPAAAHLTEVTPSITGREIAAELVPPPQFHTATFDSYRPDKDFPSQAQAVATLRSFANSWEPPRPSGFFGWGRKKAVEHKPGVYLDGGFGVGKTHLLAALWHEAPGPKYFGTFIEYTALVGALGFQPTIELLRGSKLICIDEFELDDPGDTMMMTRLLGALVGSGTRIAATSNTPPQALGEGRFAASDFLREIQSLSSHFETVRIDGLDYRRRDVSGTATTVDDGTFDGVVSAMSVRGERVSADRFRDVIEHLATVHPSKYVKLVAGLDAIALADVEQLHDQMEALRFVAFVDRVYDAEIPIVATGVPLSDVFDAEMLQGGYRKKYLRALSRLIALTSGEIPPHD
ncbi:cell division protein ZapE [Humibacter albus]|uniref:cell division protein ZapE n=1 Tax=Humibacter albus TaxID=427754 RepID=UPI0003B75A64|nr:cell division protein ZapE [Humibacter albus]